MASVNKVILIGNLGADPEVKHFEKNSVSRVSLATSENYKDKNGEWQSNTDWHNVIMWGYLSERAEKQLKKGMQIYVEGKLRTRSYDDKDGNKQYVTEVIAQSFSILGARNQDGNSDNNPAPEKKYEASDAPPSPALEPNGDENLPF